MSDANVKRLQDDLDAMRQVVGLGPSLTMSQVRGFVWLAFTGLLLTGFSALPDLVPGNWELLLVLLCWIALPVRGLVSRVLGKQDCDFDNAQRSLPRFYSATVLTIGIVVLLWAQLLKLSWPITIGILFFVEALPLLIVSVGGRRATIGPRFGSGTNRVRIRRSVCSGNWIWRASRSSNFFRMRPVGRYLVLAVVSARVCGGVINAWRALISTV